MNDTVPGYRDTPEDRAYHGREHHPICEWCRHHYEADFILYTHDACEFGGRRRPCLSCDDANGVGQCDNYAPSLSTRARQLVKLRPFVARIREGRIISQTTSGWVEHVHESGQRMIRRID